MSYVVSAAIFILLILMAFMVWYSHAKAQDFEPPPTARIGMVSGIIHPRQSGVMRDGYKLLIDFLEPSAHDERDHMVLTVSHDVWKAARIGDRWRINNGVAVPLHEED